MECVTRRQEVREGETTDMGRMGWVQGGGMFDASQFVRLLSRSMHVAGHVEHPWLG